MKLNRFFAALCAIAALGVSCSKETAPVDPQNNIVVPEGMKYVSFEIGAPTKISGNPFKWNSSSESVAVLAVRNGSTPKTYKFNTIPYVNPSTQKAETAEVNKISGIVDEDAELMYVVYPYKEDKTTNEPLIKINEEDHNKINFLEILTFDYANTGASSNTPLACKIAKDIDGNYSAGTLCSVFSYINLTFPERAKVGTIATPLAKNIYITGKGIAGESVISFDDESDTPSVELKSVSEKKTVRVQVKINKTSNLPYQGAYLVPVVPGNVKELSFKVEYDNSYSVKYADYTADYNLGIDDSGFTFERGTSYDFEISGAFVKSASTTSATVDGTKLLLSGKAEIYIGGKITLDNYSFEFKYREKQEGEGGWIAVDDATYEDGTLSATVEDIDGTKTYEAKVYAIAKKVLSDGEGTKDQIVEGNVVESGVYVAPIVITIDQFATTEYNGIDGGFWEFTGDRTGTDYKFPSDKSYRVDIANKKGYLDSYNYYSKKDDKIPALSGIQIYGYSYDANKDVYSTYVFKKGILMFYNGYIIFPAKQGYKVTGVDVTLNGSSLNKEVSLLSSDGNTVIDKKTYTGPASTPMTLKLAGNGKDNDGVRVRCGSTYNYTSFVITYTPVSE